MRHHLYCASFVWRIAQCIRLTACFVVCCVGHAQPGQGLNNSFIVYTGPLDATLNNAHAVTAGFRYDYATASEVTDVKGCPVDLGMCRL